MYRSWQNFVALTLLAFSFAHAQAQDSSASLPSSTESSLKIEDVNPDKNKAEGDVDSLLSNNLLRAQSGSKSKYSIATAWIYQGSTVNEPFAEKRPNITAGSNNTAVAFLQGDINGKYAIDQTHAVLLGFGMRWITPLYGTSTPAGFNQKVDADNPTMNYQYIYKWAGIQSVLTVGPTFYTAQDQRALGYTSDWDITQTNVYEFGHTGLSLGLAVAVDYETFDRSTNALALVGKSYQPLGPMQTDYKYAFYPYLEYQITKKVNLRALAGAIFEHNRTYADALTFQKDKVYQSVGVGISVTRDVFLYPNVQFIPDQMRASQTNVGLASYINIF